MAKTIRDKDEDKIKDYKEDIDTLLVFVSATLSSAIVPDAPQDWSLLSSFIVIPC